MAEKGHGGKAMVNLAKRAKRVQEKMMQKFGKSDQTKDEVFEEFVANFNKQHNAAVKLQKELTKYMNALRLLNQTSRSLADVIEELYEPEWEGRGNYKSVVEKQGLLWDDKLMTLQSRMVEPMSHYMSRFPEVKNRIHKRERKVVDYDLTRRELESVKAKPKVTDQKVQQTEEAYTHAKQLYDEISDELYEELPTFYDSRIQFYASLFQSIASTEAKFHSEISKIDEELANLMDSVASQAATGVHSTKKERSVVDTGPRLLSRPGEESETSSDGDTHPPNSDGPPAEIISHSSGSSPISTPSSTPTRIDSSEQKPPKPSPFSGDSSSLKRQPPSKPIRSSTSSEPPTLNLQDQEEEEEKEESTNKDVESTESPTPPTTTDEPVTHEVKEEVSNEATPTSPTPKDEEEILESVQSPTIKTPPPKPEPLPFALPKDTEDEQTEVPKPDQQTTSEPADNSSTPSNVLFKVRAAHPYAGEDEDELSFKKGDIVLVIPFEDPDDEEDGWYNGVIEGTDQRGVFPANFTKPLS